MNILYHYTSGQGLFGIINSSVLHCSNVKFLNDPSEQLYFTNILLEVINNSKDCKDIYEALYNQSYQNIIAGPSDQYIASFSKNSDSLSMWNYYSKGNGYNLGLDIELIIKRNKDSNFQILKIEMIYDINLQYARLKKYIKSFKKEYLKLLKLKENQKTENADLNDYELKEKEHSLVISFNDGIFDLRLQFKHPAYKSEEEVRLIITDEGLDQNNLNYKVSENGVFLEYITLKINLEKDLKYITTHPLNGNLHVDGTKGFLSSKINNNKIIVNPSSIPFRIV